MALPLQPTTPRPYLSHPPVETLSLSLTQLLSLSPVYLSLAGNGSHGGLVTPVTPRWRPPASSTRPLRSPLRLTPSPAPFARFLRPTATTANRTAPAHLLCTPPRRTRR